MNISDFVVITLYPNGEMGRDADGIWFRSVSPVVFQMQPVNTLEELKCVLLRNMGAAGAMSVRRVAYRLLNLFPPNQFKFKIFWVDSDAHVRAMFELHRRYRTREVLELLTEMETVNVDAAGPSSSSRDFVGNTDESSESSDDSEFVLESQARQGFLLPAPSPIPDLSSVGSHFHTLNLDEMTELVDTVDIVHEQGGAEVWWTARLFGTVNVLRSRSVRRQTDLQLHLADNKGQSFRAHSGVAICPSTELLLHAVVQEGLAGQAEGNR
ncbi:hypothetical protein PIB30_062215 [Stylosanthes scabra]|uniref:Uncharacterized protein n=2 Tax=Stylosanthes scabra TaxID=79078 RepID=A0ABU6ZJS3_9FABA|nr:hypothetical protein [Stylosanthes scabra]